MTLVGDPRIIFLDEPTAGLDPRSRRTMWQLIRELVAGGVTIFLTTQYLEEADELADRVAVLDHGRLIAEGTPEALKRRVPAARPPPVRRPGGTGVGGPRLGRRPATTTLTLEVPSDGDVKSLRGLLDRLDDASVEVDSLSIHTPTSTTSSSPSPANPTRKGNPAEHPRLRGARFEDDAAPQPPPHVALPVPTLMVAGLPVVPAVRLRLRRHPGRRARRTGRRPRRVPRLRPARSSSWPWPASPRGRRSRWPWT